jgi:hypothetical protein
MRLYVVQATIEIEAASAADAVARIESLNRQSSRDGGSTEVKSIDSVKPWTRK